MTNFDSIKNMTKEEFVEWLDKYTQVDNTPWINWFGGEYCNKCEPTKAYVPYLNKEAECAYCELEEKCKFFKELDETPDCKKILELWLDLDKEDEK